MNILKTLVLATAACLLSMQQAFAGEIIKPVPEIDGAGAIIAIGLAAGLVALVRERFFRK